jgi:hypothetical protein
VARGDLAPLQLRDELRVRERAGLLTVDGHVPLDAGVRLVRGRRRDARRHVIERAVHRHVEGLGDLP